MKIFLTLVIFSVQNNPGNPRVRVKNGVVEGFTTLHQTKEISKFLGIPFAKAPLNKLRFQPPQPAEDWSHVYDAKKLPNSCIQGIDTHFDRFGGVETWNVNTNLSEDCLYLNIWSPKQNSTALAVLIWIYGGGFYSGTSTLAIYDGTALAATENIVVVSFNYRVGMLGFVALGHPEANGNAGLFDQLMAMKWVKGNIASFGGDPERITIYGESAGAVSVNLHMVSELSWPYFSRAILGSGSAANSWAVIPYAEIRRRSLLIAREYLSCGGEGQNVEFILQCLREADPFDLSKYEFHVVDGIVQFPFVPVVDGHFLTSSPAELLAKGKFKPCPLLMGNVRNEGNYFIIYKSLKPYNLQNGSNLDFKSFSRTILRLFAYYPHYPLTVDPLIVELIHFFYFPLSGSHPPQDNPFGQAVDAAVGDAFFTCGVISVAEIYAKNKIPVYYYRFLHISSASHWPSWMGSIHGDELFYVFGVPLVETAKYSPQEIELASRMMRYWGNFIKSGDPNAPNNIVLDRLIAFWPTFDYQTQRYIIFETNYTNSNMVGSYPSEKPCRFWNSFLPRVASEYGPKKNESLRSGIERNSCSVSVLIFFTVIIVFY